MVWSTVTWGEELTLLIGIIPEVFSLPLLILLLIKLTFIAKVWIRTVCVGLNYVVNVTDMVLHSAGNCPAQQCVVLHSLHTSWRMWSGSNATISSLLSVTSVLLMCHGDRVAAFWESFQFLLAAGSIVTRNICRPDVPMKNVDLTKATMYPSVWISEKATKAFLKISQYFLCSGKKYKPKLKTFNSTKQ